MMLPFNEHGWFYVGCNLLLLLGILFKFYVSYGVKYELEFRACKLYIEYRILVCTQYIH
jgi:hypothetical protein